MRNEMLLNRSAMTEAKQRGLPSWLLLVLMLCFVGLLLPLRVVAQNGSDGNTYTTPERLFYITRSLNKNLVCYDYRLTDGKLDKKDPIHVYWVNREEKVGQKEDINFFQRKMAYGYKQVEKGEDRVVFTLTAYPKRQMTLTGSAGKGYTCYVSISGKQAILQSLYVKTKPGNPMSVEYVELRGVTVDGGEAVTEQVRP